MFHVKLFLEIRWRMRPVPCERKIVTAGDMMACELVRRGETDRRAGGDADDDVDETAALQDAGDAQEAEGLCASLRFGAFPARDASFSGSRPSALFYLCAAAVGRYFAERIRAIHAEIRLPLLGVAQEWLEQVHGGQELAAELGKLRFLA